MSSAAVRIQAGTRLIYDGDAAQVVELLAAPSGVNVVLRVNPDHLVHVPLRELLTSDRVRVVPTEPGPASDDPWDTATVVLAELTERERLIMRERAAHIREVLTGFQSGNSLLAAAATRVSPLEWWGFRPGADVPGVSLTLLGWAIA